jgi:hypothetical protein
MLWGVALACAAQGAVAAGLLLARTPPLLRAAADRAAGERLSAALRARAARPAYARGAGAAQR